MRHQELASDLHGLIWGHLRGKPCKLFSAPFDVRLVHSTGDRRTSLDNGNTQVKTVVQPDLCVVCDPAKLDKRGCAGPPDWIIEIVSPSSLVLDTRTKFDLYAENGVAEYWIAFPGEQTVLAYALDPKGTYELTGTYSEPGTMLSRTLPDLQLNWNDIFVELL